MVVLTIIFLYFGSSIALLEPDRTNLGKVNNAMIAIMISMLSADLGHTADCSNSDK